MSATAVRFTRDLPSLTTARLQLRKLRRDDAEAVFEYASDPEMFTYTISDVHRSVDETRRYLESIIAQCDAGQAAIWGVQEKSGTKIIGTCGFVSLQPAHGRAQIEFLVGRAYWGKGYSSEAQRAVLEYGFGRMGLNRVEGLCDPDNAAIVRVVKRAGMTLEGILRQAVRVRGVYRDVKLYAVLKQDFH